MDSQCARQNQIRNINQCLSERQKQIRSSIQYHCEHQNQMRSSKQCHCGRQNQFRSSKHCHCEPQNKIRSSKQCHCEHQNQIRSSNQYHYARQNQIRSSKEYNNIIYPIFEISLVLRRLVLILILLSKLSISISLHYKSSKEYFQLMLILPHIFVSATLPPSSLNFVTHPFITLNQRYGTVQLNHTGLVSKEQKNNHID